VARLASVGRMPRYKWRMIWPQQRGWQLAVTSQLISTNPLCEAVSQVGVLQSNCRRSSGSNVSLLRYVLDGNQKPLHSHGPNSIFCDLCVLRFIRRCRMSDVPLECLLI
jgi:hypothetical protein